VKTYYIIKAASTINL